MNICLQKWYHEVYIGMNRYENGKIHKIVNADNDMCCTGSTTERVKENGTAQKIFQTFF